MKTPSDFVIGASAILATTVLIGALASGLGWRVNMTDSLPGTVYRVTAIEQAQRGDFVSFCRPVSVGNIPAGPCADGSAPLLKRVVAQPGDWVRFMPDRIEVNGTAYPVRVFANDSLGQALPRPVLHVQQRVPDGQVVVMGEHEFSLDSRYFGLIGAQ